MIKVKIIIDKKSVILTESHLREIDSQRKIFTIDNIDTVKDAEIVLKNIDRKDTLLTSECNRKIEPNELQLLSLRCGSFPGEHELIFDSSADTISLKHSARNREGFALGAVVAAEWLQSKVGFFNVNDLIEDLLNAKS